MSVPPIFVALFLLLHHTPEVAIRERVRVIQEGMASYYSHRFNGKKTAFGEIFNNKLMTAAHPTLPYNTLLEVTNPDNNKKVVVRVNDRGPFGRYKRVLDISQAAASELDLVRKGIGAVQIEVVGENGALYSDGQQAPEEEDAHPATP